MKQIKKYTFFALIAIALISCNTEQVNTFEFSKPEVTVEATKFAQLVLNVTPANSDVWVEWESSNENVVVLAGGSSSTFVRSVRGVSAGTATITAKVSGDVTKSASCVVNVYTVKPTDIVFSCATKQDSAFVDFAKNTVTMLPNERVQMVATVLPDTASFRTVTWKSSNDSIATINEQGLIESSRPGTATITVTDYLKLVSKTLTVVVNKIDVTGLLLASTKSFESLEAEKYYSLKSVYAVRPAAATNRKVHVTSSNENVIRVINSDSIYTVAPGEADITITTDEGGFSKSFHAKVLETALSKFGIDLDTIQLYVGDKYDIPCVFTPSNATNKMLVGESDNPAVVEIIDGNSIKVLSAGQAKVTLTADGGKKDSVMILASVGVESIACSQTVATIKVGEEYNIEYTILPVDATNKNVSLQVGDPTILEVVDGTKVKALRVGRTTVTLTTEDRSKTDKIIIKVEE